MKQRNVVTKKAVSVLLLLALLFTFATPVFAEGGPTSTQQNSSFHELDGKSIIARYQNLAIREHLSIHEILKLVNSDEDAKEVVGIRLRVTMTSENKKGTDNIKIQRSIEPLGICYAPLWRRYGLVKWQFPNPGQNGAKYSVKPEWSTPLEWATPPEQKIDGFYRSSWGSCVAYKVPDASTTTFNSSESWDVCYNWAACELDQKCPEWINPCEHSDWPNDPLW